ncbi:hypothetical protein RFI_32211 [Reticulomyxa filosa]|uniref:RZ-type domain-containing protein n=1 Tax=Reticulomyxa filosa TaxID=46433 RepID=X6LWS7_RETFI|nr:hypothetical protein RFI_32211 [Reticulomyxa filosa]|eukprot:ETO05190.1 hypothetical protein RFI_32211 [Reticulomyxa filosa]
MDTGKRVILYKLDSIYESLYDMLNQRYQKKPSGKNRNVYCRVALGSESKDCYVKDEFKCIVIVHKDTAYAPEMPVAFLNRFEKQLISYRTSLPSETESWISKIEERLTQAFKFSKRLGKLFCGFNNDTIPSALSSILVQRKEEELNNIELDETTINAVMNLFKPLCCPEIIIEIAIDQKEKFDYKKVGQEEFPSFRKIIDLQLMKSNKQMAIILTGDFECNLPEEWNNATKKVESFKKSSDFEQVIHHFFSPNNTSQDLLILQYVHDSKNFGHFMHIKHTLEHAHHRYYCYKQEEEEKKETEQRLVVLLVHIKPPIFKNPFPLIFSRKWNFTYVDNLSSIGLTQLKTLLSQTMPDVLESDTCNNRLNDAIRRAFARLQFPVHKNEGGDIQKLSILFNESNETKKCREEIVLKLKQIFQEKGVVSEPIVCILNKDEIKNPGNVDTLSLGCSFFKRYENIIGRLLVMACTNILLVFYENCYFQVFFDAVKKNDDHLAQLFVEVIKDESILSIPRLREVMQRLMGVEPDLHAVSVQYKAMFPWSHIFHNWCHSKLVNIVAHNATTEKFNTINNEKENKNENKEENGYEYDQEKETKIQLESHCKIIRTFKLLRASMSGSRKAFNLLNRCNAEHCRLYFKDIIAAKYNLNEHDKAEVITDVMFSMISMYDCNVSIAVIESILYFLPDFFAKYVNLLKLCEDNSIVLELHTLLDNKSESSRLSDSICLLLKYFISFSSGSIFALNLKAVENAIPIVLQFATDCYGNSKEYKKILSMCRRAQIQILGVKHFGKQVIDQTDLNNVLSRAMSFSQPSSDNDKTTIPKILACVLKEGNLAMNKRPHYIRDMLAIVRHIEKLDTPDKQEIYRSVLLEFFDNSQDLVSDAKNESNQIRLQILEELVQNQWENKTFELASHEAVLLNRVLERIYIDVPNLKYNGPNQTIDDVSNLKAKLFQCINSILSITKTLIISQMKDNQELNVVMWQASQLLTHFNQTNERYQHSLHIWFLKEFYVAKGINWTKTFFTNEAICAKYPVFSHPQMSDVFSVLKYQSPDILPADLFINIYGDKYVKFRNELLQGIKSGDIDPQYNGNKSDFILLLAAALSLPNLCDTFSPNFESKRLYKVRDYLMRCNVLKSDVEQNFVKVLLSEKLPSTASSLRLTWNTASDSFIPRLCFHFLGVLQIMNKNPFRALIINPKIYVNGHLPTMPENLLISMIRVMKSSGQDGDSFTVRYCPNMHPFIISKCGHPTEKVICAMDGCGQEIGNTTHRKASTGLKQLEIPKGYVLDGSDEELSIGDSFWRYEEMIEVRKINEVACTLMRLLIHLSLLIRNAAVVGGCKQLQELLHKKDATEVTKFLQKQAIGYFRLLGKITSLNDELLSVALHQILDGLPQTFNEWYPNGLNGTDLTTTYEFEKKFNREYNGFFGQIQRFNEVNSRNKITVNEDKALKMISEIEEIRQVDELYQKYIPHLFLTIHNVTFDDLAQRFKTEPSLQSKYPLLYYLMSAKDEIWCVRYLPVIGQWMKHVYFHYSKRITQQGCQKKTISQALEEWKQNGYGSEVESYQKLWSGFKTCWNTLANQKVNNGCKSFVIPKLHDDNTTSLEFSTARNNENGLIIVKIIELLQDTHNAFLERVLLGPEKYADNEEKYGRDNEEKYDIKNGDNKQVQEIMGENKSLFHIHENDVICLDKDQVTEIIRQWSLPSLEYGAINQTRNNVLDLSAIENEIFYRFIKNRQILEISIPSLQFSNQLNIKNCVEIIEENNKELKKEPKDQPLLKNVVSSLKSQSEMQRALEILNEVIVFVSQNIKIINLDNRFVELLEQMSFDEKNCKLFMVNSEEQKDFILCRHMCNLWRLLNNAVQLEFVNQSTIDNYVLDIYKVPLTESLKQELEVMVKKTPLGTIKEILDAWREVVQREGENMRDLDKKEPFRSWLDNIVFFDNELELFPKESLTWEYCAAGYAFLHELFKRTSGN